MVRRFTPPPVSSSQLASELETEGGFTVHEKTGDRPAQGFAVADFGAEKRIPAPGATTADIGSYRGEQAEALSEPQKFLGGWRDNNEGAGPHDADYLDVSSVVGTRREAFAIGQQNAQRAVMDLSNFKEHSVPFQPGLPGPRRTGQTPEEFHRDEAQNREHTRSAIEHQRHGRADPSQARVRGEAIADEIIGREQLHARVRGSSPKAQVKRGKP